MEALQIQNADLKQHADALFEQALDQTKNLPALHAELQRCDERLRQPMRVAIVGKVNTGKSTLMNALLEEKVVETGEIETTFNVNWLRYGNPPSVTVYYKEEHLPSERKSYEELAALTRHSEDPQARTYLSSIKYIQVSRPNKMLRSFDLIDTPGLGSVYEDDARNTLDFIMEHGNELTAVTQEEAAKADAVLYLFFGGVSELDDRTLQEFLGGVVGKARPFNAIGVWTKVDTYWDKYDDPVRDMQEITKRLASNPQVHKLFYAILPVAGLLAFGTKTMTEEEFQTLMQITTLPLEQFKQLMVSESRFIRDRAGLSTTVDQRKQVVRRLGMYGIRLAYKLINVEGIKERTQLVEALFERSGLPQLRKVILSHFGNRVYLIKLSAVLDRLEIAFRVARSHLRGAERELVCNIADQFQRLRNREIAFKEIEVLGSYYEGNLLFSEEEGEELLQVTGEYGITYADLLGMPKNSTLAELKWAAETQLRYWKEKALDFGFDRPTTEAADVMAHSYNRILYHLGEHSQ